MVPSNFVQVVYWEWAVPLQLKRGVDMILHDLVDDDLSRKKWFLLTLYTRVLGMGCNHYNEGGGGDMMLHDLVDGDLCVRNEFLPTL